MAAGQYVKWISPCHASGAAGKAWRMRNTDPDRAGPFTGSLPGTAGPARVILSSATHDD
jgi:hypothetical protein